MRETHWIAFELRDGLMQWVIGARMHLAALLANNKVGLTPEAASNLEQILSYLHQAADEGRQLIRFIEGLPPGETVDAVATLERTCELLTRKTSGGRPEITFFHPRPAWP